MKKTLHVLLDIDPSKGKGGGGAGSFPPLLQT